MDENKTQLGIFARIKEATSSQLDLMIAKSKASMSEISDDAMYRKSVYKDVSYATGSQGYIEKHARMSFYFLKQMSVKNSIVAAIIQTYQNQIADFSHPVDDKHSRGFRITLKNEKKHLDAIMKELFGSDEDEELLSGAATPEEISQENRGIIEGQPKKEDKDANDSESSEEAEEPDEEKPFSKAEFEGKDDEDDAAPGEDENEDNEFDPSEPGEGEEGQGDEKELTDREKLRKAKEVLQKRTAGKVQAIQEMIMHCGYLEDRPFESKKWDFDSLLRAWVRDSLTYDQYGFEMVEDKEDRPHHWVPVDGSTVRQATPELKNYKNFDDVSAGYDILYPEKELEALRENDALKLDEDKLQADEYKWVQVVQGRVVRAFTEGELAMGMRNPTTDIYANGYSLAELELLVGIVSSHIFTENYNKSYFTQGFSAKGLLHIKANLPRRKLESFRVMWNHMLKGNKNSFQTPIIAGVDEVNWIPLTQNHSDIEFNLWMQYLIKIICAIYQIDPMEIGFGMRDMGQGGGSLSGDNSEVKLEQSKSKGLRPMLKHIATFVNKNIVDRIDPNYKLEFVGVKDESVKDSIERQLKEAQYKKTVNELREEDGLPPLPGCDDLILSSIYFQWYQNFSPEGKAMREEQKEQQRQQMAQNFGTDPNGFGGGEEGAGGEDTGGAPDLASDDVGRPQGEEPGVQKAWRNILNMKKARALKKSKSKERLVQVEFYRIKE